MVVVPTVTKKRDELTSEAVLTQPKFGETSLILAQAAPAAFRPASSRAPAKQQASPAAQTLRAISLMWLCRCGGMSKCASSGLSLSK